MAVVFQGQGANGASAAPTHAFTSAVGAASVLLLLIQNRTNETTTITSVTDTNSNTWTALSYVPVDHTGGTTQRTWAYICQNANAGTPTVTINFSGSISSTYAAAEFTGAANTGQPDTEDVTPAQGSSSTPASNSINPAGNGVAVLMAVTTGAVTSSGTTGGWTQQTTAGGSRVHIWTKTSSAGVGESLSTTWSASTGWIMQLVNIADAGAAGGSPLGLRLLLLGCG